MTVRNTTIVGNMAGENGSQTAAEGGAVQTSNDQWQKLRMLNCIIADNTTVNTNTSVKLSYAGGVNYCLFDLASDLVGANNKSGNPMFKNAANRDYHLSGSSPAIGGGVTYVGIDADLAAVTFAATPSIGCYEFFGPKGLVFVIR